MGLNIKETKLLIELFKDARLSNRQLSSLTLISKETISKKIEEFEKNDIIKGYKLKINYGLLNFREVQLLIKLKKGNSKVINEIKEYLIGHNNSTWIGNCLGKYDFKVTFEVKDIGKINEIIHDLRNKFTKNIDIVEPLIRVDIGKFSPKKFLKKLFNNEKIVNESINLEQSKHILSKPNNKEIILDLIDKRIIYELGQNPRKTTLVEISNKLDTNAEMIKNRLNKLKANNIVNGSSAVINGKKFNKIWGLLLLNINSENICKLKKFLEDKEFLSNYTETLGHYNFQITYFADNIEELYESLNEIKDNFSEDIHEYENLLYFEIYKSTKIPKCILE